MFKQSHILFAIIFFLAKPKYQGIVSDSGMQAQGAGSSAGMNA
jgi:hypothetical protein